MKTVKYILSTLIVFSIVWGCANDEFNSLDFLESAEAPTNVAALITITQDNTGFVTIAPTAEGAVLFDVDFGDSSTPESVKVGRKATHTYAEGNYNVGIVAKGNTGLTTTYSKDVVVSFNPPMFGTEPVIENDPLVSKKVNVTVPDDTQWAMFFDVYFVEDGIETILTGNIGETVSYLYANPGLYTIKIVLKGGAIATTEYTVTDFEVTEILAPVTHAQVPEMRDAADYISIFSDAYTDIVGTDYSPWWWQSTVYAMFDLEGDAMLQYSNLNYQGIEFGSDVDAVSTSMEYVHIDVWTPDVTAFEFYLISRSSGEKFVLKDLVKDQWNSFDIPLSEFTDQGLTIDDIFQFKFVGSPWAADGFGTIFVDNLYFWKAPTVFADLPITFDSSVETFEPFLGAEFEIAADPDDANNPVGKITNYGQGWGWEGVKLALDTWVDLSIIPTIKLDFYNDGAPHDVLLKLEDSTSPKDGNGNPTVFEEVHAAVSNTGWSQLIFNFTSGGSYDTVVLFVDGGVYDITGVYYFDNVVNEEYIALPLTMDTPGQTFEPFLGAEFEITTDPDDANNQVGKITNYGQGWGWEGIKLALDEWIDLSTRTSIKMDFYNDGAAHDVLMKLEDSTSPKDGNGNPTVFEEIHVAVSNSGWSTLTFDFTSGGTYDTVVLFVDGGVYDITGVYYFDNIIQP